MAEAEEIEGHYLLGNEISRDLLERVAKELKTEHNIDISYSSVPYNRFANGNVIVDIGDLGLEDKEVHVVLQHYQPNRDRLIRKVMETDWETDVKAECLEELKSGSQTDFRNSLILLDAVDDLERTGDRKPVNIYLPFYPDGRQERKTKGHKGEPMSAKKNLRYIEDAIGGPDKIRSLNALDIHTETILNWAEGYEFDNLSTLPLFVMYLRKELGSLDDVVLCGPDEGSWENVNLLADRLGTDRVLMNKYRPKPNECVIVGEEYITKTGKKTNMKKNPNKAREYLKGKHVVIIDDIIDTAGTMMTAKATLDEYDIAQLYGCGTHTLNNSTIKRDKEGKVETISFAEDKEKQSEMKVIATDTIPREKEYYEKYEDFMTFLSSAPVLAQKIRCSIRGKDYHDMAKKWLEYALTADPKEFKDYRLHKAA